MSNCLSVFDHFINLALKGLNLKELSANKVASGDISVKFSKESKCIFPYLVNSD